MPAPIGFVQRFHIQNLITILVSATKRFPFAVLISIATTILAVFQNHNLTVIPDGKLEKTIYCLSLCFFYTVSIKVFSESRWLDRAKEYVLLIIGYGLLAAIFFIPDHFSSMHLLMVPILMLSWSFAPYINRPATEDSVWYYNYQNVINILFAWLSSLILCVGLSAIVGSIQYLFEIPVMPYVYSDIWIIGGSFFCSIYVLSQIPRQFDFAKQDCKTPKGIAFIANYLLAPLCLAYMFILYGYFAKIVFQWTLPRGNLAYMITGFGFIGVLTHLMIHPLREQGTRLLQEFDRYFYKILLVPLILLAVGIYTRINDYGLTEQRYYIALCLVWFTSLSVLYTAVPRKAHIKYITLFLSVLLLLSVFGPLSARYLSGHSQAARLEAKLRETGILTTDGHVVPAEAGTLKFKDKKTISSAVDYLFKHRQLDLIQPWIDGVNKQAGCSDTFDRDCSLYDDQNAARQILRKWNVSHINEYEVDPMNRGRDDKPHNVPTVFTLNYPHQVPKDHIIIKTADYDYGFDVHLNNYAQPEENIYREDAKNILTTATSLSTTGTVSIQINHQETINFEIEPIIRELNDLKHPVAPESIPEKLILIKNSNGKQIKLQVWNFMASPMLDGRISVSNVDATILIKDLAPQSPTQP